MKGNWKKKLTKAELRHLAEDAGFTNLAGLKRTLKTHAAMRHFSGIEPCWICRGIGRKLDLDLVTVKQGGPAAQGEKIPAPANEPDYHRRAAVLAGCYTMVCEGEAETGLSYKYGVYYFFPKGLLSNVDIKIWEDEEDHCLSSAFGYDRQASINHVQAWALEQGIKVTKKAIGKAFSENNV